MVDKAKAKLSALLDDVLPLARAGVAIVGLDRPAGPSGRRSTPQGAGYLHARVHRRVGEWHERHDVYGTDPRVLARVLLHVDLVQRPADHLLERPRHRLVVAGHREHGAVVARVGRPVEQEHARDRGQRLGEAVHDLGRRPSETLGTLSTSTPRCYSPAWVGSVGRPTYTRSSMTEPRRSLLHHPDFLKLWTAETVSVFGSAVTQLALPLIAATVLQVNAFEFGLLTTIEFLPFILFSLPAGVWVDRLRRRRS